MSRREKGRDKDGTKKELWKREREDKDSEGNAEWGKGEGGIGKEQDKEIEKRGERPIVSRRLGVKLLRHIKDMWSW